MDRLAFPIVRGIPRFVGDDAYSRAFGKQWHRFAKTQLDSHTGLPISAERARRCLGSPLWENLSGLHVLEVGCGAGRFTEVLLGQGASVTSIDMSAAVDVNAANCGLTGQHRVSQADVLELPFAARQFDVVFCLGVIQHTPNPEATIQALADQVAPGGYLVIDHYVRTWRWYLRTAPLFRMVLKHLGPERGLRATEWLFEKLEPLHRRAKSRPAQFLVNRLSPITVYDDVYPEMDPDIRREWGRLDTHDMLTDWFKHRRSAKEIREALTGFGLTELKVRDAGNGVEARARQPLSREAAGPHRSAAPSS